MGVKCQKFFTLKVSRWEWIGIALSVIGFLLLAYFGGYNPDEIEHMHVTYLMNNGHMPYRDFPQNHLPIFWFILLPFVKALSPSIKPFLIVRMIQVLLLVPTYLVAKAFLPTIAGIPRALSIGILFLMLGVHASYSQWIFIRPDVLMAVFITAGIAVVGAKRLSYTTLFVAGVLLGIATCLSIKSWHAYFVVFLVLASRYPSVPLRRIVREGACVCLGSLPPVALLVSWLVYNDLAVLFFENVFVLNGLVHLTLHDRLKLFESPIVIVGIAGALSMVMMAANTSEQERRKRLLVAGLILVYPFAFQLHNHGTSYHALMLIVPSAVAISFLFQEIYSRLRNVPLQIGLTLALPMALIATEISTFGLQTVRDAHFKKTDLMELIRLTKGERKTCTAFSHFHPVFCSDVSGAMLGWDITFYKKLKSEVLKDRYRELLHSAYEQTIAKQPDIILERGNFHIWWHLKELNIISPEELNVFRRMVADSYSPISVANGTILLKKSAFPDLLESNQNDGSDIAS